MTDLFATLMEVPLSCPNSTPSTRLFFDKGTRAAWSTTDKRTKGCITLEHHKSAWYSDYLVNDLVDLHIDAAKFCDL